MVSGGIHSITQFGLDNILSFPSTYILYSTLTRLFVTFFSVCLSYKILPILLNQPKCCFLETSILILLKFTVAFFVHLKHLIVLSCSQQNSSPNNAHAVIFRTCDHVILHGKRNFADATHLRILK